MFKKQMNGRIQGWLLLYLIQLIAQYFLKYSTTATAF
jgi:hypothetical protein